jgi:hypothetical protein
VLAICGSLVGAGAFAIAVVEQSRLHESLVQAAAAGIIVDVSPDQFQLALRIAFSLILGSICLWSKFANRLAVVVAALIFLLAVPFSFADSVFDRAEPEILMAALIILAIAVIFYRRDWSGTLNAMLAAVFVILNFIAWFVWTERIKRNAEVETLYPNTRLNNTLYGAEPWHLVLLLWTLILLVWAARLMLKESKKIKRDLAGLSI